MAGTAREDRFDVIVIGAGVVGCLTARALSRYRLRVLLLEKASDVGTGATKANTAIVHAGYDPLPGTNKARFNVLGNRMYPQICAELNVQYNRQGDYVVGIEPCNAPCANRAVLRERGLLPVLEPGETREITVDISVLDGQEELAGCAARCQAVR